MSAVDRQAEPLAKAGEGAALTVGQDGTVVVTSTEKGTVTTLAPIDAGFGKPRTRDLPGDAGQVSDVTTVGDRIVTLDADAGVLSVVGGATASVPPGSKLQQPGPGDDAVLVGAPDGLLSVDLESGDVTTVSDRSGTSAVEPVRLGAASSAPGPVAWAPSPCSAVAGGHGATTSAATPPSLAFRVNRGEIVLNDANSGTVWDVSRTSRSASTTGKPSRRRRRTRTTTRRTRTRPTPTAGRRGPSPTPTASAPGARPCCTRSTTTRRPTVACSSIVDVDQPSGGARVEISPDGQTLVLEMPEDARPARFDYFIDDGRNGLSANAAVDVSVRGCRAERAARPAGGLEEADLQGAARR